MDAGDERGAGRGGGGAEGELWGGCEAIIREGDEDTKARRAAGGVGAGGGDSPRMDR